MESVIWEPERPPCPPLPKGGRPYEAAPRPAELKGVSESVG